MSPKLAVSSCRGECAPTSNANIAPESMVLQTDFPKFPSIPYDLCDITVGICPSQAETWPEKMRLKPGKSAIGKKCDGGSGAGACKASCITDDGWPSVLGLG